MLPCGLVMLDHRLQVSQKVTSSLKKQKATVHAIYLLLLERGGVNGSSSLTDDGVCRLPDGVADTQHLLPVKEFSQW